MFGTILLGWGDIENPSPYAAAGRKRRLEGAPRDQKVCSIS
jgi:hypothetical protein